MSQGVEQRLGFLAAQVSIDKTKLTKEMLEMALKCKTPEELIAMAKTEGIEITKAEAEALFEKLQNEELDAGTLDKVAGGSLPPDIVIQRRITLSELEFLSIRNQ